MVHPWRYPNNYDWLPTDKQAAILQWFERQTIISNKLYEGSTNFVNEIATSYFKQYQTQCKRVDAAQELLEEMGIFVEYNWAGHRGEWILATYADAEMEEDWQFQCAD